MAEDGEPDMAHSVALAPSKRVLASHCVSVLMYEVEPPFTTWVAVIVEASASAGALLVIHAVTVVWADVVELATLKGADPELSGIAVSQPKVWQDSSVEALTSKGASGERDKRSNTLERHS